MSPTPRCRQPAQSLDHTRTGRARAGVPCARRASTRFRRELRWLFPCHAQTRDEDNNNDNDNDDDHQPTGCKKNGRANETRQNLSADRTLSVRTNRTLPPTQDAAFNHSFLELRPMVLRATLPGSRARCLHASNRPSITTTALQFITYICQEG